MERAGEEAPLPEELPAPFARRRTVTFDEGTGRASSRTTSSASTPEDDHLFAFDPWAAARTEESSSGHEEDLLRDHQRAALSAPVATGSRPNFVGWTRWENWEEMSGESESGWHAPSNASSDRASDRSWSASSWSSDHRGWRDWESAPGDKHLGAEEIGMMMTGGRPGRGVQDIEPTGRGNPPTVLNPMSELMDLLFRPRGLLLPLSFIKDLQVNVMGTIPKKVMVLMPGFLTVTGLGVECMACHRFQQHRQHE